MKRKIFLFLAIVSVVGMIAISGCGKERVYTVTFDANGGTGEMKQQTFVKDVSQALISNVFTRNGYVFAGWNTMSDGSGVAYSQAQEIVLTDDITLYAQWKNGYEYVDLGLPSGRLWATCNVGANSPEGFGDYFAWGEIASKDIYDRTNYKYYDTVSNKYIKYTNTDSIYILQSIDDAATANWGTEWRMPTHEDFYELCMYCEVESSTLNGVNGYLFTGTNSHSIFFPVGGYRSRNETYAPEVGYYWSSSRSKTMSGIDYLIGGKYDDDETFTILSSSNRCVGFLVRPVIM